MQLVSLSHNSKRQEWVKKEMSRGAVPPLLHKMSNSKALVCSPPHDKSNREIMEVRSQGISL